MKIAEKTLNCVKSITAQAITEAKSGHLGASLGMSAFMLALFKGKRMDRLEISGSPRQNSTNQLYRTICHRYVLVLRHWFRLGSRYRIDRNRNNCPLCLSIPSSV